MARIKNAKTSSKKTSNRSECGRDGSKCNKSSRASSTKNCN